MNFVATNFKLSGERCQKWFQNLYLKTSLHAFDKTTKNAPNIKTNFFQITFSLI